MPGQLDKAILVVLWHFEAVFLLCVVILKRQCPCGISKAQLPGPGDARQVPTRDTLPFATCKDDAEL